MGNWRATLIVILALWSSTTASGQQSGVLVSFLEARTASDSPQTFEEILEPKYRTSWIAPDAAGKLAVLSTIPGLVVPRKDGFWHVGVKQVCEFDNEDPGSDGGNEHITQEIWSARVEEAGIVPIKQGCKSQAADKYAPPFGRSEQDKNKISQCGYVLTDVEYLSPAVISVKKYNGQSEDCEARGGRYSVDYAVVSYGTGEALAVSHVLGPEAREAYRKALPAQGKGDDGEDCGEPSTADDGWRIDRIQGHWGVYAHQDLGYFGCAVDVPVRFRLPSSVTGDNSPQPDWKGLQAKVKDLRDAYVSPAKDLLILVTGTELTFYEYAGGGPGRSLLTLPARGILMLQWCTGPHVQDWSKQLERVAGQALPEAVVRVAREAKDPI